MTPHGTDWQAATAQKSARLAAESGTTIDAALAAETRRLEAAARDRSRALLESAMQETRATITDV